MILRKFIVILRLPLYSQMVLLQLHSPLPQRKSKHKQTMPLTQLGKSQEDMRIPSKETPCTVSDEDTNAGTPQRRREWYEFLRFQICTHKGCHRIMRTRRYSAPAHTLCYEHGLAVFTAASEMLSDWQTGSLSRGLSPASSVRSGSTPPSVEGDKITSVEMIQSGGLSGGTRQSQTKQCASQQQQQATERTAAKKPQRKPSRPVTGSIDHAPRVDMFNTV